MIIYFIIGDQTMPFSGYTEKNNHCKDEVMFMRARLHMLTGRRRLHEGKISLGIITLYDALYSAMQWYAACPEHAGRLIMIPDDNVNNDSSLFDILSRSAVITSEFDYIAFSGLVDAALYKDMSEFDYSGILADVESVMTQLGAMPPDDSRLVPDGPGISRDF